MSAVLELGEGVFGPVPRLVHVFIEVERRLLSIAALENAGLESHRLQIAPDPACVVTTVGNKKLDVRHDLDQFLEPLVIADIAASEVEADGPSLRVCKRLTLLFVNLFYFITYIR